MRAANQELLRELARDANAATVALGQRPRLDAASDKVLMLLMLLGRPTMGPAALSLGKSCAAGPSGR